VNRPGLLIATALAAALAAGYLVHATRAEDTGAVFAGTTASTSSFSALTLSAPSNLRCGLLTLIWDAVPHATSYFIQQPIGSTTQAGTSLGMGLQLTGTYTVTAKVGNWSSPSSSIFVLAGFC